MPREPVKLVHKTAAPSLQLISANVIADIVSAILCSVAGAIALIALSFAIYAGLKDFVSPPLASGGTALVYLIIAAVLAVIVPRSIKSRAASKQAKLEVTRSRLNARTVRAVTDVAFAVLAALAESVAQRRLQHQSEPKSHHSKTRRRK